MPASPICEIKDGGGLWVPTTDGVDVTPGNTISVRLVDSTDVVEWYLRIFGTDELTPAAPTLSDVNPLTHKVMTPVTVVTFPAAATTGHALLFESIIVTPLQTISTTFGIYELTDAGLRVGAVGETREASVAFGWAETINAVIRGGGGGGGTLDGDVTGDSDDNTVVAIRGMPTPDPVDAATGRLIRVADANPPQQLYQPRILAFDGTHLFVGNSVQHTTEPGPHVNKILISGATGNFVATATAEIGTQTRDIAVDDNYVYAALWQDNHVAVIDKATMTVVGYGDCQNKQATSVCCDNLGNFYVNATTYWNGSSVSKILKFSAAGCIGQPPDTHGPDATYDAGSDRGRWIRFGGGAIWFCDGGNTGFGCRKIDPVTMTPLGDFTGGARIMSALYAFGSVWVTSQTGSGYVYRFNPTTLTLEATIPFLNVEGMDLTVGPNLTGDPLWIYTASLNGAIGIIDAATNTVVRDDPATPIGGFLRQLDGTVSIGDYVYFGAFENNPDIIVMTADETLTVASITDEHGRDYYLYYVDVEMVGDVEGPLSNVQVVGLRNTPINATTPTYGQTLLFNGVAWAPGKPPDNTLDGLSVYASSPTTGDVLTWSGSYWYPAASGGGSTLLGYTYSNSYYQTGLGYSLPSGTSSAYYQVNLGAFAGYSTSSYSDYSVHVGGQSGYSTNGPYNVCLGFRAGYSYSYTSATGNILIGTGASLSGSDDDRSIVIANSDSSSVYVYGKGTNTTLIGRTDCTDAWIRGTTQHFGNETAVNMYWLFQRSASGNQPGFFWNNSLAKLQWSNGDGVWNDMGSGGGGTLAGDVTGATTATTVVKIQNRAVAATAPTDAQVLAWNAALSTWKPADPPAPSLAITQVTMEKVVPGVGVTPGWEVLGAFVYNGAAAKLQAMVLVSMPGLTVNVRLYGPTGGVALPVPGSTITSTSIVEEVIESVELTSALVVGEAYQFQMECTGGGAVTDFAVARSVALVSA